MGGAALDVAANGGSPTFSFFVVINPLFIFFWILSNSCRAVGSLKNLGGVVMWCVLSRVTLVLSVPLIGKGLTDLPKHWAPLPTQFLRPWIVNWVAWQQLCSVPTEFKGFHYQHWTTCFGGFSLLKEINRSRFVTQSSWLLHPVGYMGQ